MNKLLNYKIKFMANSTLDLTPSDQIKIQDSYLDSFNGKRKLLGLV